MSGPKTLSSAHPNTTLTGSITGLALANTTNGYKYYAAVYGPSKANFTVTNNGTIHTGGADEAVDAGILLAAPGTVTNNAIIKAGTGILLQSTSAGSHVYNNGYIFTAYNYGRDGILLNGAGTVGNAGTIISSPNFGAGINMGFGGTAGNSGYISAYDGIASRGNPSDIAGNSGTIIAFKNGITLASGGTAGNTGAILGHDAAGQAGLAINGGFGTAANLGLISGFYDGIIIGFAGGDAYNLGTISASTGISIYGVGYALNEGTISAQYGSGIYLESSGAATNSGLIKSNGPGVFLAGGGYLLNFGQIESTAYAVQTGGSATINNEGQISGYTGIFAGGTAKISNALFATITGTHGAAILMDGGGYLLNFGQIAGKSDGVDITSGGTILDFGTITGATFGVSFAAGYANRLVIDSSSVIKGSIDGGKGVLELGIGGTLKVGTISPAMVKQFADFSTVQIDAKTTWDFTGSQTLHGALVNNGTIKESSKDTLTIAGALTGSGLVDVSKNALTLNGAVASGEKIAFGGTNETLNLGDPTAFKGKIEKLTTTDTIDLTTVKFADIVGTSFAKSVLTIITNTETLHLSFASPGAFGADTLQLFADGTGTGITLAPPAAVSGLFHLATSGTTLAPLVTFSA